MTPVNCTNTDSIFHNISPVIYIFATFHSVLNIEQKFNEISKKIVSQNNPTLFTPYTERSKQSELHPVQYSETVKQFQQLVP